MRAALQGPAGAGSGASHGHVARFVSEIMSRFAKTCGKEGSREPSPAPDCLQRKIEALRAHPTEIFNFMVVSGTPRLGKGAVICS